MVDIKKCREAFRHSGGQSVSESETPLGLFKKHGGTERQRDGVEGGSPGFARMNEYERRRFKNNKLLSNAVK